MVTLVGKTPEFKPDIGDLPFNWGSLIDDYLWPQTARGYFDLIDTGFTMFPVSFFNHYDPFRSLQVMEVDCRLLTKVQYECPFVKDNKYYGIVPIGISTSSSEQYRLEELSDSFLDHVFDLEYQRQYILSYLQETGPITGSYLGHGFDFGRLPSDGDIKIIVVKIKLSNGDFLVAKTFEWYNK